VSACAAPSADRCVSSRQAICLNALPQNKTYLPSKADACINAVQSAYSDAIITPDEIKTYVTACAMLYDGPSGQGGPCSSDADCKVSTGLKCLGLTLDNGATTPKGLCETPSTVQGGSSCSAPESQCPDNFHCGPTKHCDQDSQNGEACSAVIPCDKSQSLKCNSTSNKCEPQLENGSDCQEDAECKGGVCIKASTAPKGVCAAEVRLAPNEPFCTDFQ
jgi:hypothetical protein